MRFAPFYCSCFWFCVVGLPNVNVFDEPEPPVPKALGVAFIGLPSTGWLESLLVAKADGCPNIEPVAPDGTPKVKEVAGFAGVLVEADVVVAALSFFPNANVDTE